MSVYLSNFTPRHLGDNCIVFDNFTASGGDLMVDNFTASVGDLSLQAMRMRSQ